MQPQQPPTTPVPNYDFILSPQQTPKRGLGGGLFKNDLIVKLIFLVGSAVVLMIIVAVALNLFFSNKTNLGDLISLTAAEQEIVRVSAEGKLAVDQPIKNAAMNTQLSITSHQQDWFAFLGTYNTKVTPKQLILKKDTATDRKLTLAKQNSTFDPTYTDIMRGQLESYAAAIKRAYMGAGNKTERALLDTHYTDVKLLLEQWPQ